MDADISTVNKRLAQLYNIEEYETLSVSSELNIELLLKAKEYFSQNLYLWGQVKSTLKSAVVIAETQYQTVRACKKVEYMGKGDSGILAQAKAESSKEFAEEKKKYGSLCGDYEEAKEMVNYLNKRIDAIQQHISILKAEGDLNKFIKE